MASLLAPSDVAEEPYWPAKWNGWNQWHNWGVGYDSDGVWSLFHFQRDGGQQAFCRWIHHRQASISFEPGEMDLIARTLADRGRLEAASDEEVTFLQPIVSGICRAISAAIAAEGNELAGSPIGFSNADRLWRPAIRFGAVVSLDRHRYFDFD